MVDAHWGAHYGLKSQTTVCKEFPVENPTLNLNIVKTEIAPCTIALKVEVLPPRVQKTFGEVIAMFSKQAKIPGFRAGKVPMNVILKRFGDDVNAETRKRLIGNAFEDAIKAENPDLQAFEEYDELLAAIEAAL